jgi:hypothetical protein
MRRIFPLLVALLLLVPSVSHALPAFPGAEGWGSDTVGGRSPSSKLCKVNSLSDAATGSCSGNICSGTARWCLHNYYVPGPKIVIFTVGGTIDTTPTGSGITIREPFTTVAGQTAPGGGILLTGPGIGGGSGKSTLTTATHDVIIRGLRIRDVGKSALVVLGSRETYGIGYNIIIDHNSLSWSDDEVTQIAFNDVNRATWSYNIISEGVNSNNHSTGAIVGSRNACDIYTKDISIHHNLFAHNGGRNPLLKQDIGRNEIINNVVYDWDWRGIESFASTYIAKNVLITGPSTTGTWSTRGITIREATNNECPYSPTLVPGSVMVTHNIGPDRPTDTGDDWLACDDGYGPGDPDEQWRTNSPPFTLWGNTEDDVTTVKSKVLNNAGATVPSRDSVDIRVVNDVLNGTGAIINSPADVGGYPTIAEGSYPTDTDGDGMPDAWETANGLNPSNKNDWNSYDVDPNYMNIEVYINSFFLESDTTPPVRYDSTPGSLPSGTTQYNVTLTTTDDSGGANCRIGTVPLVAYADMTNDFDTTGGTSHSELVTGLSDGNTYNYYVRCQDLADPPNANPDDYLISFMVQNPSAAGGSFSGQGTFQ